MVPGCYSLFRLHSVFRSEESEFSEYEITCQGSMLLISEVGYHVIARFPTALDPILVTVL